MFDKLKQRFLQRRMRQYAGDPHRVLPAGIVPPESGFSEAPGERAARIISDMTLDEKIDCLSGTDTFAVKGLPRLGLPSIYMADATSGVCGLGEATGFPAAVALAATWDRGLLHQVGEAIGEECRAKGAGILLGPGVNIARVPTCGRNFEYLGEDPYLAGELAAAYITGAQGRGVITTVKHFACNNSEYDRHKSNSVVDERTLHEIYLPAFRKAVQKGESLGIMSSYNQLNGTYASENSYLLQEVLREQWGFDGFVVSDWNSLYSTIDPVKHGLDLEMPGPRWLSRKNISKALDDQEITEKEIDQMLTHLLTTFIRAGILDRPMVDPAAELKSKRHRIIAAKAADEAVVLLKNNRDLLPLKDIHRIAVVGNNGLVTATGGGGSSYMLPEEGMNSIYDALRLMNPEAEVEYIEARRGLVDRRDLPSVMKADAVVIATGFNHVTESEAYDRSWKLPDRQDRLIEQMTAVNRNCIVILHGGGAVDCAPWIGQATAVLHAMYLGQEAGNAVARVIYGWTNPSGHLPFSMAEKYEDYESVMHYVETPEKMELRRVFIGQGNPNRRSISDMIYAEGLKVGYRGLEADGRKPLFPFGHGLSYTKFSLMKMAIQKPEGSQFPLEVSLTVKNTGKVAGAAVVQLYVHDAASRVFRPPKELKNFLRVELKAGRQQRISLELAEEAFSFYDAAQHQWVLEPGTFTILAGLSSSDIRLQNDIDIG